MAKFRRSAMSGVDTGQALPLTREKCPLVAFYSGFETEYNRYYQPIPWIHVATTGLNKTDFHPYDRVQYVYDCNVLAYIQSEPAQAMKVWHGAVQFRSGEQLERILLVEDSRMLDKLCQNLPLERMLKEVGYAQKAEEIVEENIYLAEKPIRQESPYANYTFVALPAWKSTEQQQNMRNLIRQMKDYTRRLGMEDTQIESGIQYRLKCRGHSIVTLNFCGITVYPEPRVVELVQQDCVQE